MTQENGPVDLFAPIEKDVILEVRGGRMKNMRGLEIQSGIDKEAYSGPVKVGSVGITDDEHDLTFHGGPDKAIHGCESSADVSATRCHEAQYRSANERER